MLYRFNGKQPMVGEQTYISELAHVIGDVIIGDECYIGHGAILRGDYGGIEIGDGTAIEEGVIVRADRLSGRFRVAEKLGFLMLKAFLLVGEFLRRWEPTAQASRQVTM